MFPQDPFVLVGVAIHKQSTTFKRTMIAKLTETHFDSPELEWDLK